MLSPIVSPSVIVHYVSELCEAWHHEPHLLWEICVSDFHGFPFLSYKRKWDEKAGG